jgi:hypothetical protein
MLLDESNILILHRDSLSLLVVLAASPLLLYELVDETTNDSFLLIVKKDFILLGSRLRVIGRVINSASCRALDVFDAFFSLNGGPCFPFFQKLCLLRFIFDLGVLWLGLSTDFFFLFNFFWVGLKGRELIAFYLDKIFGLAIQCW